MVLNTKFKLAIATAISGILMFTTAAHAIPTVDTNVAANPDTTGNMNTADNSNTGENQNTSDNSNPSGNQNTGDNSNTGTIQSSVSCKNLTTVAEQGGEQAVLFTWITTEFGEKFTPQKRCEIVSAKFNEAVQANGGKFTGLNLGKGIVKNLTVICVTTGEECTSNNMLFTLKRENAAKATEILEKLKDINNLGSTGIEESTGASTHEDRIELGSWVKSHLRKAPQTAQQQHQIRPQLRSVQKSAPAQRTRHIFQ